MRRYAVHRDLAEDADDARTEETVVCRGGTRAVVVYAARPPAALADGGAAIAQITAAGGTLTVPTSTGSMTTSFRAGATSVPLNLTWSLGDPGLLSGDKSTVSPVFHLEAHNAGGSSVTQFAKPWTRTVEASGRPVDPVSLELGTWNEATRTWDMLSTTVDTGAKSASATLDHLSQFVLVGELAKSHVYLPMVLRGR